MYKIIVKMLENNLSITDISEQLGLPESQVQEVYEDYTSYGEAN